MNRKMIVLLCLVSLLTGCTYAGERTLGDYLQEPATLVRDPHFSNYKEKRDAVESQYLKKEISYSQYLEQTKELDDQYAREVQQRENIITESSVRGQ